jgi:hypothetical protein
MEQQQDQKVEKFLYFPEEWGVQVYLTTGRNWGKFRQGDLDLLAELRETYRADWEGKPIPYKEVLSKHVPGQDPRANKMLFALHRLMREGYIHKFAEQVDSRSGQVSYILWYIWEDKEMGAPMSGHEHEVPLFMAKRELV